MSEHQTVDPSAHSRERDANLTRKKVTYGDGTANMFYGQGSRVNISEENIRLNGGQPHHGQELSDAAYYAEGESGHRYYFSGPYDLLIVDTRKEGELPKVYDLNGEPPEEVTVGALLRIPGYEGLSEPVRTFAMLVHSNTGVQGPTPSMTEYKPDESNPLMDSIPKFKQAHEMLIAGKRRSTEPLPQY